MLRQIFKDHETLNFRNQSKKIFVSAGDNRQYLNGLSFFGQQPMFDS
jgi:hypothetical protein